VDPGVRPVVRAPWTGRRGRCNRASSSGQPAGVSPARGDARVLGSGAPGVDREVGVEVECSAPLGGAQLAGPQHEAKPAASLAPPALRGGTRRSRARALLEGEGHGRHPRAWSGCLGISRRKGRGTVRRLSWELERAVSAPGCGPGKQRPPITGGAGKWRAAERQSEGVVVVLMGGTT